ncbi:hypothetical protein [Jeongeupia chitinilytica]|uniref:GTPase n=1 Tax=Jeongeupia chitinilytica TaxID=1041641 RepID=A0ABQ3H0D5_9NEIS|nr:hypothetical protein [Jeongeupia chitinilytica]GHD58782.1 hypothetical protein GCM10007350_09160 [Jeongeupia chitinilytica]
MREFLNKLFKRDSSPFAGNKLANAWCRQLELDAPAAQRAKVLALARGFVADRKLPTPEALEATLLIDAAAQSSYDALCCQYVANPRMSKELERQLWTEIVEYAQAMIDLYQRFVKADPSPEDKPRIDAQMPQVLARSLHYLGLQAKWYHFRFERLPSKLWTQANQLYRLSEIDGFDSNPFPLYPGHADEVTSCADEYLQLLMLATLSSHNLTVRQLDWADHWLDRWSKLIQLSRKFYADRHHLCVNLQEDGGPVRVKEDQSEEPFRYWGLFDLIHELQETQRKLENGATPVSLGLGQDCRQPASTELLRLIESAWTTLMRNTQVTRSARQTVSKTAEVVQGLGRLCAMVRADNDKFSRQPAEVRTDVDYDEIMDMRLYGFVSERTRAKQATGPATVQPKSRQKVGSVAWAIENESEGGFGAILHAAENEWIRPGALIGMRTGEDDNWRVCVVRRLNRLRDEQLSAGIQILSATPVAVSVKAEDDENTQINLSDVSFLNTEFPMLRVGLYIPHLQGGNSVNTLMLHASEYANNRLYSVKARDRSFTVKLGSVLEKGADWVWANVQVVKQND